MNQAIHSVDLLSWLMGPVAEIRAQAATRAHKRIAVEDTAVATLRFKSGALGVIEATTAAWPGYLKRIEIHGSAGTAILEEEDLKVWDFAKKHRRDAAIHRRMQETHSGGAVPATRPQSDIMGIPSSFGTFSARFVPKGDLQLTAKRAVAVSKSFSAFTRPQRLARRWSYR